MVLLDDVIRKMENSEDYIISYRPPPYIRKKLAQVLREGDYRNLAELLNKALDEWLKDRETKKRIAEGEVTLG